MIILRLWIAIGSALAAGSIFLAAPALTRLANPTCPIWKQLEPSAQRSVTAAFLAHRSEDLGGEIDRCIDRRTELLSFAIEDICDIDPQHNDPIEVAYSGIIEGCVEE